MRKQSETKQRRRRIIAAAILLLITAGLCILVLTKKEAMFRFFQEPEQLRIWVENHGILGQAVYVACMIFQIILAVIPGEPLEVMAGYAFGAVQGTLLCLGAATLGSALVFLLVRRFGMDIVELFYPAEKVENLSFLKTSPKRTALFTVVFAIPGTPKDLLCYLAGLTDMKFSHFLLIASFGRIPSIFTSTLGGSALGDQKYTHALVIMGIVVAISLTGLGIYHWIVKFHSRKKKP